MALIKCENLKIGYEGQVILENINFDKIIEKHMTIKKDKNSDYKIYLCKFNRICYDNKFEEKYKDDIARMKEDVVARKQALKDKIAQQ